MTRSLLSAEALFLIAILGLCAVIVAATTGCQNAHATPVKPVPFVTIIETPAPPPLAEEALATDVTPPAVFIEGRKSYTRDAQGNYTMADLDCENGLCRVRSVITRSTAVHAREASGDCGGRKPVRKSGKFLGKRLLFWRR